MTSGRTTGCGSRTAQVTLTNASVNVTTDSSGSDNTGGASPPRKEPSMTIQEQAQQLELLADQVPTGIALATKSDLDDLALDEDRALAVARRHTQIGLAGLARAVDDAAHDGHPQRDLHPLEPGGDLLGEGVDVDLRAPARRARHDLQLALLEVQRL